MNSLFFRALVAFLLLPGVVAFVVPLLLLTPRNGEFSNLWALIPLGIGMATLFSCVREFYVAGTGTLAPWSPPTSLVTSGLYRRSRNPMYVGVVLILAGWATGFRSGTLALYALVVLIAFHLRVVLYEEPWLARTFTSSWFEYQARTPRWL